CSLQTRRHPRSTLFPYTTLFRSLHDHGGQRNTEHDGQLPRHGVQRGGGRHLFRRQVGVGNGAQCIELDRTEESRDRDGRSNGSENRKSTRLNSSHVKISYAVFCL